MILCQLSYFLHEDFNINTHIGLQYLSAAFVQNCMSISALKNKYEQNMDCMLTLSLGKVTSTSQFELIMLPVKIGQIFEIPFYWEIRGQLLVLIFCPPLFTLIGLGVCKKAHHPIMCSWSLKNWSLYLKHLLIHYAVIAAYTFSVKSLFT